MGLGFIIIFFDLGVRVGIEIMFRLWIWVIVFVILREREVDYKLLVKKDKEELLLYLYCIYIRGEILNCFVCLIVLSYKEVKFCLFYFIVFFK